MVSKGQPFTKETIETIANQFTNGSVEVIEHLESDYFTVKFVSAKGITPKIQDVYDAINEVKASWLDVDYEFKYNTVEYIKEFTVGEISKYTVGEVLNDDLGHGSVTSIVYSVIDENGDYIVDENNDYIVE